MLVLICGGALSLAQQQTASGVNSALAGRLPDLVSATSDEPIVAIIGQDAFISCVAKNLRNYTIIWRFTNNANGPTAAATSEPSSGGGPQQAITASRLTGGGATADDLGAILTAGRQRVSSDDRFSVIQSHDTWLLKITNVRASDTGTYICHTNSEPQVRAPRILSVIKPSSKSQSEAAGKCSARSSALLCAPEARPLIARSML